MPDHIDQTLDREAHIEQLTIDQHRKQANLDPGKPGDCDLCGEWSGRLIKGVCAPCRDHHHLP
jgi:hypothetical protein